MESREDGNGLGNKGQRRTIGPRNSQRSSSQACCFFRQLPLEVFYLHYDLFRMFYKAMSRMGQLNPSTFFSVELDSKILFQQLDLVGN